MSRSADPTAPTLAVPDGWILDEITSDRLHRQLLRSVPDVAGIVAERALLPSGSSHLVAAERGALVAESELLPVPERTVHGAVLVRAGVDHEVGSDTVTVADGRLLVDRGATIHDASQAVGALEDASPLGRPPFPYRPLVLFLGFESDRELAARLRDLVDDLLSQGTEGRLALPVVADGRHRTRPCRPTEASVRALAPDVVVGLDPRAVDAGARWLGDDRSAVVVELAPELGPTTEIVSWRIGVARGRVRARIGADVPASALAPLVRRLCAGPQALPPTTRASAVRRALALRGQRWSRPTPAPAAVSPALVVLLGPGARSVRDRFAALSDHAAGARVNIRDLGDRAVAHAEMADGLVVRGCAGSAPVLALVESRTRRGLPTLVDLAPDDLVEEDVASLGSPLVGRAERLVGIAGRATTTRRELVAPLRLRGIRVHVLPTLFRSGRLAGLRRLAEPRRQQGPPVLGCHVVEGASGASSELEAVEALIGALLDDRADLVVDVVGGGDWSRALAARDPERVRCREERPPPSAVARWRACVALSAATDRARAGHLEAVVEAQLLGVPTLVAPASPAVPEGLVAGPLRIATASDADAWRRAVDPLLDDPLVRARHSADAHRLAEALYGPPSATAAVERFLGWIRYSGGA